MKTRIKPSQSPLAQTLAWCITCSPAQPRKQTWGLCEDRRARTSKEMSVVTSTDSRGYQRRYQEISIWMTRAITDNQNKRREKDDGNPEGRDVDVKTASEAGKKKKSLRKWLSVLWNHGLSWLKRSHPTMTGTWPGTRCIATEVPKDHDLSGQEVRVRDRWVRTCFSPPSIPDVSASLTLTNHNNQNK